VSDVAIQQCLYLIKNGFKAEEAFALDDEFRIAFWIMLEEQSGRGHYNFESGLFEVRK
jgi:hypothetical protein